MAKIELILKKSQTLKNGSHPIILRVAKKENRVIMATGLSSTPEKWNDEFGLYIRDKRLNPEYSADNEILTGIKAKADSIVKEFERLGIDWTIRQFSKEFDKKIVVLSTPATYFENHIQKLKDAGRFGNADVFNSTLVILRLFDKKFDKLKFPDIDIDYIQKFEKFLRVNRNAKDTTISFYMRTFATLLNAAITDGLMQPGAYPFAKNGYRISKLNVETKKRFIPVEYLRKLKEFQFDDLRLETARNLFMFSFHCRGINWIDMATLTPANIFSEMSKEGKTVKFLKYTRTKTHKEFDILINDDIQSLLNWFKSMPHCEPYLLPIVTRPEHRGEAMRMHIRDRRSKYNKALNDIVKIKELEFPEPLQKLTSYFSRHSFAMALRAKGTNIELISEALGHADLSTTNVYLDSFGRDAVADISENLI